MSMTRLFRRSFSSQSINQSINASKPTKRGSNGGDVFLIVSVALVGGTIWYVHKSQRDSQQAMHAAVVLDRQRLRDEEKRIKESIANKVPVSQNSQTVILTNTQSNDQSMPGDIGGSMMMKPKV